MNYLYEFYYVFFNSYRLKIKKPGPISPGIIYSLLISVYALFSVHRDQELFIGFGLAHTVDQEFHGFDGGHVREVIPEYP